VRGNGFLVAQASRLPRRRHLPCTEAGEPLALSRPSGSGEVSEVTIHVWYLRNIAPRRIKANTYLLAHSSECYFGERHGHHSMKLSHKSYFKSEWRVRVRRILRLRDEKGSTLFELALILPLLSMLLVGIIMGGVTFYDYVTLAEAVAVGARSLATNAGIATPCTTATTALTNAATSLKTSAITVSISFPSTDTHSDSCTTIYGGDTAMVNATYPCNMTIPFTGINLCPVSGPSSTTNSGGATTMSCPYASCISSTTTVEIE